VKDIDGALLIMLPTAVPAPDNSASAPRATSPQAATPAEKNAPRSFWQKFRFAQADLAREAVATSEGGASAKERRELPHPKLEEVVVTAQKRIERLIEVPQSVTVLSADDLARSGAVQLRDFAAQVPGLTLTTAGAGYTQVSLRGVTTGQDISSTVATYVDDVPIGSSSAYVQGGQTALDVGLFDMERIEVLRGPQGTLYGSASMGGLIKYVSRRPDLGNYSGQAPRQRSTRHSCPDLQECVSAATTLTTAATQQTRSPAGRM
jgi:outer membrane receptor protein involved in Fe transport